MQELAQLGGTGNKIMAYAVPSEEEEEEEINRLPWLGQSGRAAAGCACTAAALRC